MLREEARTNLVFECCKTLNPIYKQDLTRLSHDAFICKAHSKCLTSSIIQTATYLQRPNQNHARNWLEQSSFYELTTHISKHIWRALWPELRHPSLSPSTEGYGKLEYMIELYTKER
jgi:hypothetical protein